MPTHRRPPRPPSRKPLKSSYTNTKTEGELKNRALREERARRRAGERLEGPAASQEAPAEALEAQEGSQDRSEHSAARRNHSQRPRRHRTSAFHAHSSGRLLLRRRPSSVEINSSSFTA
ncbi:hypothetical protein PF011_g11975 [Phytophthora fragariae]|uniref:Uncharacterized protein n=1 Tax=Phytophthora fragariae TaxID=53985 RepID=A0A6A3KG66_9STRA|nr:hypothetical protein PF003_g33071 [Phytophthora fragariae]KAE9005602.1 hypothetical protein PF011_g11975 [Phytophthora fragariae]